jgi:pyridoxal 5'-phosphate synthase pdxS subunit
MDEGAAMIRTKGEAGTGNIVEAVRHMRMIMGGIRELRNKDEEELWSVAREIEATLELVRETAKLGKLPVVNFAAGGVATPSDAALMMQLGADGVFVGSGIFKSENPELVAKAIVEATHHYREAEIIAEVSRDLGKAMPGLEISEIPENEKLQTRGW